jgi:hypothetical protein
VQEKPEEVVAVTGCPSPAFIVTNTATRNKISVNKWQSFYAGAST